MAVPNPVQNQHFFITSILKDESLAGFTIIQNVKLSKNLPKCTKAGQILQMDDIRILPKSGSISHTGI